MISVPLSLFVDALPYNEMKANYADWQSNMQVREMIPNIAYSSSLHWQLYCDQYPDDRGVLVDWVRQSEKNKVVRFLSTVLAPLDKMGNLGVLSKKALCRYVMRRNAFANIPYRFRKDFSEQGSYLFWDEKTYRAQPIFDGYTVISQDEGHRTFEVTLDMLRQAVERGDKDIFGVFGFADALGHKCRRGEVYSDRLRPYMKELGEVISLYREKHPEEEVLMISDHGMSTVERKVDLCLEEHFGKQKKGRYIAYCDTAVMSIWCDDPSLEQPIREYLSAHTEGHLLTEDERAYFRATDRKFGDILYILREGNVFADNWFGKSIRKPNPDGTGMHGFWPEWEAKDQMACVVLIGSDRALQERYDYPAAHLLIKDVMKGS